jgi:hypothetical protein
VNKGRLFDRILRAIVAIMFVVMALFLGGWLLMYLLFSVP